MATKTDVAVILRRVWGREPDDGLVEALVAKRPRVTPAEWKRVAVEIRGEQEKAFLPTPKRFCEALPLAHATCVVCGGRGGVTVVGYEIPDGLRRGAPIDERDLRQLGSWRLLRVCDAERLRAEGWPVVARSWFGECPACANGHGLGIAGCLLGPPLAGWVALAGMGPDRGPPVPETSAAIVARVARWSRGERLEPERCVTADELREVLRRGGNERLGGIDVLGSTTLADAIRAGR